MFYIYDNGDLISVVSIIPYLVKLYRSCPVALQGSSILTNRESDDGHLCV